MTLQLVPDAVPLLCQLLLAGYGAVYLATLRRPTRAGRWLAATLAAYAAYAAAHLLSLTTPDGTRWPLVFNAALYLALVGSTVGLAAFGHTFLGRPFPRAHRATVALGGAVLVALAAYSALAVAAPTVGRWRALTVAFGAALVVGAAAAVATLTVRAVRLRRLAPRDSERAGRRRAAARAHATFGALTAAFLGLAVVNALAAHGAVPLGVLRAAALVGPLAVVFGLVAAYLNHAPEPTTVQAKLVGLVLALVLLVLGAAGEALLQPAEIAAEAGNTLGPAEAVRFAPDGAGGVVARPVPVPAEPAGMAWVEAPSGVGEVALPFAFPFGGSARRSAFVSSCPAVTFRADWRGAAGTGEAPRIVAFNRPCGAGGPAGFWTRAAADAVTFAWRVREAGGGTGVSWLTLHPDGAFDVAYRGPRQAPAWGGSGFHPGREGAPVVALPAHLDGPLHAPPGAAVLADYGARYRAAAHERTARMGAVVLAAALGVVVLLPVVLGGALLRPLGALAAGARRLEAGDLAARVPARSTDEVGVLARRFNAMAAAVEGAQADLRAYASALEDRVAERTAALHEKSEALAASLAELRAAQDRLVQAEKMASLGRLTSGIAHELKNPLNFVTGFAGLTVELAEELDAAVRDRLDAATPEARADADAALAEIVGDLRQNAVKIGEHADRADRVVRAMLAHHRGAPAEPRDVDLAGLLDAAAEAAEGRARQRRPGAPGVVRDLPASLGTARLAPDGLAGVVGELLDNALYAVAQVGGDGAAPAVVLRARRTGAGVEVRVEDGGPGLDASARARAFEPFFTTKPPGEGVGLGLSLAYDAVTAGLGGTLTVESAPGAGAAFTVTVPAGPAGP